MTTDTKDLSWLILVVEDIEEIRDGIEQLLQLAGYRVEPARTQKEAILKAKLQPPDLILVSLAGSTDKVIRVSSQIRQGAELEEQVPIVIFCIGEVPEGEEVAIGHNIYLTHLDNFNQLKGFMHQLLSSEFLPA